MNLYKYLVVAHLGLVAPFVISDACAKPSPISEIDLDDQVHRQVVVDREAGQYLGHPTTCLLEDGKTMLCVYPKGHGGGAIVYKRSTDTGLTWSNRLPTPASWATSKEVPTLHRVIGPDGEKRIIMWSGLYPARLAVTEDDGANWSELKPVGDWVGWVGTWDDIVSGRDGQYSVRLKDNTKGYDTTYPGVETLPDGTFVVTTYGHWIQGEPPYILSVRFKLGELDAVVKRKDQ